MLCVLKPFLLFKFSLCRRLGQKYESKSFESKILCCYKMIRTLRCVEELSSLLFWEELLRRSYRVELLPIIRSKALQLRPRKGKNYRSTLSSLVRRSYRITDMGLALLCTIQYRTSFPRGGTNVVAPSVTHSAPILVPPCWSATSLFWI
jgi:hypothetical protein